MLFRVIVTFFESLNRRLSWVTANFGRDQIREETFTCAKREYRVLFLQPYRTDYLVGERFGLEKMLPESGMRRSSCAIPPAAPFPRSCHRNIIVIIAFLTLLVRLRPTG